MGAQISSLIGQLFLLNFNEISDSRVRDFSKDFFVLNPLFSEVHSHDYAAVVKESAQLMIIKNRIVFMNE